MDQKFANALFQPTLPPPVTTSSPKPPTLMDPAKTFAPQPAPVAKPPAINFNFSDGMKFFNPSTAIQEGMKQLQMAPPGFKEYAKGTENVPPLQGVTHHLPEGLQGPVNSALGFVQKGLKGLGDKSPQMFAGLMGGVAPEVTKGLLSTPVGLPILTGLHGLLRGGDSFAATKTLFNPLLKRIGM